MPAGPWLQARGRTAIRRRAVAISHGDGNNGPNPSRTSGGRRRSADAPGIDNAWRAASMPITSWWRLREKGWP
jgi:hypothetical protein